MPEGDFGHEERLPEEIRDVFMCLCQDVAALKQKWDFYQGLYGRRENFPLFDLAPLAFRQIEESVRNDLVMSICRLGDPAQTRVSGAKEDNLTFAYLADHYETDTDLQDLVKKFRREDTAVFRNHRNKFVGHSDLNARLNPGEFPIESLAKDHMDTAFATAARILNHIAFRYVGTNYGFGETTRLSAGALIDCMRQGQNYRHQLLGLTTQPAGA